MKQQLTLQQEKLLDELTNGFRLYAKSVMLSINAFAEMAQTPEFKEVVKTKLKEYKPNGEIYIIQIDGDISLKSNVDLIKMNPDIVQLAQTDEHRYFFDRANKLKFRYELPPRSRHNYFDEIQLKNMFIMDLYHFVPNLYDL